MRKPKRLKSKTREEWLKKRRELGGIGGSDCSAITGASSWKTSNDLWMEKTGQKEPPDISDNEFIQKGVRLEPAIREVYKAMHPDRKIAYHKFDMLYLPEHPFIFATLDGEVRDENGRMGCLEIKTSTPNSKTDWEKWNERVPDAYYHQCLHELLATGYEFVDLFAFIFRHDGDFVAREYRFEREDLKDDLNWLLEKETEFWQTVQNRTLPPMTLVL